MVKRKKQNFPQEELDQVSLPDPVQEDITGLKKSNAELTNHLLQLEEELRELRRKINTQNNAEVKQEKET